MTNPTQRIVLLKYLGKSGVVFFTNGKSRKSQHIKIRQNVSALFPWSEMHRQVELNGIAEKIGAVESTKYFALRRRGSQLGSLVSEQSKVISNRSILLSKFVEIKEKFAKGKVPAPVIWTGFRTTPSRFEFWQGRQERLHDRLEFTMVNEVGGWQCQRLSPYQRTVIVNVAFGFD